MDILFKSLAIVLFLSLILIAITSYESLPSVYWSYTQDKCIKVITADPKCNCENLPEKYERVWVK